MSVLILPATQLAAEPVESALNDISAVDPQPPVKLARTMHFFDLCIACAVHVIDPHRNKAG